MRKRSKYKPRAINAQAHIVAMLGAARLSTTDAILRADAVALAVEDVARGKATKDAWRDIFDAVNVTEELIRRKIVTGSVERIQTVMVSIMDRSRATGTRAVKYDELSELRGFAADYAAVLSGVTNQEFDIALRAVRERVRRVMASKRLPDDLIVVEAVA